MLHPAMTRFHITAIVALACGAFALGLRNFVLFAAVAVVFLIVAGFGVAFPQLDFFGRFICRGSGLRRCAALTFDDGPDADSTPQLLDLLKEAKVEAAFFCVGKNVAING